MLFYVSQINSKILKTDEITHFKTMRVKIGQIIDATDLNGTKAKIHITEINSKYTELKFNILEQKTYSQNTNSKNTVILSLTGDPQARLNEIPTKPNQKTLFQAITDKVYLEKLCEIAPLAGITTINLFFSDRSIQQNVQIERLNKILIRACEQSETLFLPKLIVLDKKELAQQILEAKPAVLGCYLDKEETKIKTVSVEATPVSPFEKSIAKNHFQSDTVIQSEAKNPPSLEGVIQPNTTPTATMSPLHEGYYSRTTIVESRTKDSTHSKIVIQSKAKNPYIDENEGTNTKSSQREVAAELTEGVQSTQENTGQSEQNQSNFCLVGPEGGWSERELAEFQKLNLEFVSLGTTIFPAWLAGFRYFTVF